MSSNSFVYLPTKKHHRMSSNSFVYVIFQKKSEPQFVCMSSNSFVYLQTPAGALSAWFCFPGVCSSMSTSKPRRSTFSQISASRGLIWHVHGPNPAEALSAWFLLPGGLLWHVHLQTRRNTFSLISASRGLFWHVQLWPQFIRMSSNSFVYLPKTKSAPQSYVFQLIRISFRKNWTPNHSYVFQSIRISSQKKTEPQFIRMSSNSFIHLPKNNLNTNSFVCLPIHSYIFQKNQNPNSFVCLPIHSYIFQQKTEDQFIRMPSTIHSYIFQKKLNPNSFVCLPIHSYIFKKNWTPIHSYVFQFIRISSNPAEALSAWFLLPGGLLWHVHRQAPPKHFQLDFFFPGVCSILLWHVHLQTPPKHFQRDFCFPGVCSGMSTAKPRRSTFGLISASRVCALACPPLNPAGALSAWFLLPRGLLWHVHLQTPPKHFQPDFFFPGVWICCARKVNAVWKKEDPKAFNLKWLMWNLCPGPRANP